MISEGGRRRYRGILETIKCGVFDHYRWIVPRVAADELEFCAAPLFGVR